MTKAILFISIFFIVRKVVIKKLSKKLLEEKNKKIIRYQEPYIY